jgi:hypothetical protein
MRNQFFDFFDEMLTQTPIMKQNSKTLADRYHSKWYDKRIKQNAKIKRFLLDIIEKHKEDNFHWSESELMYLNYEDLAELAVACVNKNLTVTVKKGEDHSDGSDTKVVISQHRNNTKLNAKTGKSNWMNSFKITGTNGKIGAIRAFCYNSITEDFEFYYIPRGSFQNNTSSNGVEIVLESYSLPPGILPTFTGKHVSECKWNIFQVDSFEEMATASH